MKSQNEKRVPSHPIILCHGFGVIVTILQDSHLGKIRTYYEKKGILAFDPHVTPYAGIKTRAMEWKAHIIRILNETSSEKCHLVAHSMGGLDIRMLSHDADINDNIASIHTISTPHLGTVLANFRDKYPAFLVKPVLKTANLFASRIHKEGTSDIEEALDQLDPRFVIDQFNPRFPLVTKIPFYSYTGISGLGTDVPIDVTLKYFNKVIFEKQGINDGFVSLESAKFGDFVGTFNLAHQEQIGLGVKPSKKPEFFRLWETVLEKITAVETLEF